MKRMTCTVWFSLGASAWLLASSACAVTDKGPTPAAGGSPSGAAGSGETGGSVESPGQGGDAGVGGEETATGGAGEPGGSAGTAGTAGTVGAGGAGGCRSVVAAAQEVVDAYVASLASYRAQVCPMKAELPCYEGDERCLSPDEGDIQIEVECGCLRENIAANTCRASALTADQFTCADATTVQEPPDPCPTELAAYSVCQVAVDTIFSLAEEVCSLEAGLSCYAYANTSACAYAKFTEISQNPTISQYTIIGCQDAVQRLYMCLAGLTLYDFECREVGTTVVPAVKQGFCETVQKNLDLCAC